jgi:hypothetical protein
MIFVKITYRGANPRGVSQWAVNEVIRESLSVAVRHWHKNMLPLHFTTRGATMYGYAPRQSVNVGGRRLRLIPYETYKFKRKHHSYPLVWSGKMRSMLASEIVIRPSENRPRISGHMRGPDYLRPPGRPALVSSGRFGQRMPDVGKEVLTVSPPERETLLKIVRDEVLHRFPAMGRNETVLIG